MCAHAPEYLWFVRIPANRRRNPRILCDLGPGRRVLRAASAGFPDIAVTHADKTMIRGKVVFVGRAV